MLSYTEEIRKYIEEMKERKGSRFSRFMMQVGRGILLLALLIIAVLISVIIWVRGDLTFNGIAVLIATASFCLAGLKKSEFYVLKRMARDKDLEKFVSGLEQEAKKQKIFIRDIQVFENNRQTYLKIYYN